MAKIGRNDPCRCGSGSKTKRCCGVPRGPSPAQQATAFFNVAVEQWAPLLVGYTDDDLDVLFHQTAALPADHLQLHATLPRVLPPAIDRLCTAIADRDPNRIVAAIPHALDIVDTPTERHRLARAVLDLHDHGHHIDCDTTAYAILDLAKHDDTSPALMFGAIYHALALQAGTQPTPSGLILASA